MGRTTATWEGAACEKVEGTAGNMDGLMRPDGIDDDSDGDRDDDIDDVSDEGGVGEGDKVACVARRGKWVGVDVSSMLFMISATRSLHC